MLMIKNRLLWVSVVQLVLFLMVILSGGCDVKKVAYETMQNVKEQQCLDDPSQNSPTCLERESYDSYERKRQHSSQ